MSKAGTRTTFVSLIRSFVSSCQTFKMVQPDISHLLASQPQVLQFRELSQMHKPGIAHPPVGV